MHATVRLVIFLALLFVARPLWELLEPSLGAVAAATWAQLWVLAVALIGFRVWPRPPRILPGGEEGATGAVLRRLRDGTLAGLGLFLLGGVGYAVSQSLGASSPAMAALRPADPTGWLLAGTTAVTAAVGEEIAFRGLLLQALSPAGPTVAILASALLFAAYHQSLLQLLSTALLGVGLALLARRHGDLLGAIIAHLVYNGLGFGLLAFGAVG